VKALKEEFKHRGLLTAAGEHFTVTRSDQISSRLDVAAVKQFLGDPWRRFETTSITTFICIEAVPRLADELKWLFKRLTPQLPRLANPVALVRAGTVVTAKRWSA
jgi:hypothetical protein